MTDETVYYEDGTPLITAAVLARLEPVWTVDIRLSDDEAEWVLACVELCRTRHPHQAAARIASLIARSIAATRARRTEP